MYFYKILNSKNIIIEITKKTYIFSKHNKICKLDVTPFGLYFKKICKPDANG